MIWTPWLVAFDGLGDAEDFAAAMLADGLWAAEPVQTDLLLYADAKLGLIGSSLIHPLTQVLASELDPGSVLINTHRRNALEEALHRGGVEQPVLSPLFMIGTGDDEAAEALRRRYRPWTWARRSVRHLS